MGQNTRDIFQFLKDEGYNFLIGGFHVKGQVINPKGVAEWGYGGQTVERGDRKDGKPDPDLRKQSAAWLKQVVLATHELPGTARHDPARLPAEPDGGLARPPARRARAPGVQERRRPTWTSSSSTSIRTRASRTRGSWPRSSRARSPSRAPSTRPRPNMFALHRVLESQGIKVQGVGREAYRS